MTTNSDFASGGAVASQEVSVVPFEKRTLFLGMGIALIVLAACNLILLLINNASSASHPFFLFNSVTLALLAGILAFSGIMLLVEGASMRKRGIISIWCVLIGAADLLLAGATFFSVVSAILLINYGELANLFSFDFTVLSTLMTLVRIPAWILSVAAGVLYIAGGISQKSVGKIGILSLITGIALILNILMVVVLNISVGYIDPVIIRGTSIVAAMFLFIGRCSRGLAPLGFPKVLKNTHTSI